jgi:hypothetical protein
MAISTVFITKKGMGLAANAVSLIGAMTKEFHLERLL